MHKHKRPSTLRVGTISSDTLRTEDLFPALMDVVRVLKLSKTDRIKVRQLAKEWNALPEGADQWDETNRSALDYLYEDLLQLAEGYCPPYSVLGMHDGDGSDLGVWPCVDVLQESILSHEPGLWHEVDGKDSDGFLVTEYQCGDVVRASVPRGQLYVVVSDHGNISLYRSKGAGKSVEVWGVV